MDGPRSRQLQRFRTMTPEEYSAFLKKAFDSYLKVRQSTDCLDRNYLPFDAVELDGPRWRAMGDVLIEDELRALTNNMNAWLGTLKRWHAWLIVAREYAEDDRWEPAHEFLGTIATYCLFQPSAIRDAFTFVVTNGLHQVCLATDAGYEDRLPLDQAPWDKPTYPTRRKKEDQLAKIAGRWPEGNLLLAGLRQLDDKATRDATSDFRNRASHSIAPHLSRGFTRMVTRSVVQATRMEECGGGYFNGVFVPGKVGVSYGFGGRGR